MYKLVFNKKNLYKKDTLLMIWYPTLADALDAQYQLGRLNVLAYVEGYTFIPAHVGMVRTN